MLCDALIGRLLQVMDGCRAVVVFMPRVQHDLGLLVSCGFYFCDVNEMCSGVLRWLRVFHHFFVRWGVRIHCRIVLSCWLLPRV